MRRLQVDAAGQSARQRRSPCKARRPAAAGHVQERARCLPVDPCTCAQQQRLVSCRLANLRPAPSASRLQDVVTTVRCGAVCRRHAAAATAPTPAWSCSSLAPVPPPYSLVHLVEVATRKLYDDAAPCGIGMGPGRRRLRWSRPSAHRPTFHFSAFDDGDVQDAFAAAAPPCWRRADNCVRRLWSIVSRRSVAQLLMLLSAAALQGDVWQRCSCGIQLLG